MLTLPCVVLVCGLPGSGKSFFTERLASRLDNSVRVSSDLVRIELGFQGKYKLNDKLRVYREMGDRVRHCVDRFSYVLVEGTFFLRDLRKRFRKIADSASASFFIVEVTADEETIKTRMKMDRGASEADYVVHRQIKSEYEPIEEPHLSLSSEEDVEAMISKAIGWLGIEGDEKR